MRPPGKSGSYRNPDARSSGTVTVEDGKMRFVLIAAIAASFLSQSAGARLAGNDAFTFRYEAFFSGFRIAEATTTLEWKDDRYAMQLHALSAGVLEWFITFDQLASSGGRLDHEVKAERHRNHNRSRDNWIDLRFRENTVEIVDANPDPASEEGRPAVPPELLIGALDPLSAALALGMSTRAADSCDSEVPVYDGRRRYDTILEHQRRETYRGPAGPAETLVCRFRFERRA